MFRFVRLVLVRGCSTPPSILHFFFSSGPRDDEFAGKKFSFVRYTSICAVIPNSQDFENAAREAGKLQAEIDKAAGSGLVF